MKFINDPASSAKHSTNRSFPQQVRITLSMIGMELENDLTEIRSRFAKAITKVFGIKAK